MDHRVREPQHLHHVLAPRRVQKVTDVVKEGDMVTTGTLLAEVENTTVDEAYAKSAATRARLNGLRRAYLQLDRWTIGQDWTTFQNPAVLPESTDYVGGAEGTVFVRQPLIRYSAPLGKSVTLHVAAENPESGTASLGAALRHFDLEPLGESPSRYLSSGQKRRTNLARLLANPRPLWLLDEPVNALDAASCLALARAVARHRARGGKIRHRRPGRILARAHHQHAALGLDQRPGGAVVVGEARHQHVGAARGQRGDRPQGRRQRGRDRRRPPLSFRRIARRRSVVARDGCARPDRRAAPR